MQPLSNIRNLNGFKHERKIWQKVAWNYSKLTLPESIVQLLNRKNETLLTDWKDGTFHVTIN